MQVRHSKYNLYFNRNHWTFQVRLENTIDGRDMRLAHLTLLYQNKMSNIQINQPTRRISLSALLPVNTAQHVSGILMPIIRSLSTAIAASGLSLERGGSSFVGRGRSGSPPDHDQQHCYHHVPTVKQRRLLQLISSWWWAWGCPKHVELYLNDRQ